jgi:glyoxylase-like metal-dependent hydrolase (beta-lactamase superfamily II)
LIDLGPGIHSLGHKKGGHVHAFLIENGNDLTLVDTLFESDGRVVLDAIRRLGRNPKDLKQIAITHGHRSHLGGLATLKRASGATVLAREWEADIVAGERPAQSVSLVPRQSLRLLPFQIGLWLNRPKHTPCPVDEPLADGDAFGPLQVIDARGHSPGHLAFWWPERRFLIAGDAVATWPELGPGWRGFNLNLAQHRASLRKLAALDAQLVGVGHGDPITTGAAERVHEVAERVWGGYAGQKSSPERSTSPIGSSIRAETITSSASSGSSFQTPRHVSGGTRIAWCRPSSTTSSPSLNWSRPESTK